MAGPPGTGPQGVVIVATDIVSSSSLWEEHGSAFQRVLDLHDRVLIEVLEATGGYAVRSEGDGLRALFTGVTDALTFCQEAQRRLAEAAWPPPLPAGVSVRMGVHCASVPIERDPVGGRLDTRGLDVIRAEHLADIAHGGQVLFSEAAALKLRGSPDRRLLRPLGRWLLPGLDEPMVIYEARPSREGPPQRPRSTPAPHTNILISKHWIVGRDRLLSDIATSVEQGASILALTGPPGVGKSAVADALARASIGHGETELALHGRAGAWRVELEGVCTAEGLAAATAAALAMGDAALDPVERVSQALSAVPTPLLVLDNGDRLPAAGWAPLQRWQSASPGLVVVITRRAAPAVERARVFPIPPLALPATPLAPAITASPAGALFLTHGRAARRSLEVSDAPTCEAVFAVLQWTGGLPLAIELCASRLRVLSPSQLGARLRNNALELFSERSRRAGDAGRSLSGALDRATADLGPEDRAALGWLSVFHGGFSDEAGQHMVRAAIGRTAPGLMPNLHVFGLLQHAPAAGRWSMLAPVAAFARSLLGDQAAAAHAAHARIFGAMGRAQRQAALHHGVEGLSAPAHASDLDNLVEATRWAVTNGEAATAFLARRAATELLLRRGPLDQVVDLSRAVRKLRGLSARDHAEIDWAEGWAQSLAFTPRGGLPLLQRSLTVDHGDAELRAHTLRTSGRALGELGRTLEGLRAVDQALAIDSSAGWSSAVALDRLAKAALLLMLPEPVQAEAEARAALEGLGDRAPRVRAMALGTLARARGMAGANAESLDLLRAALTITQQQGEHRVRALLTGQLGVTLQAVGRLEEAAEQLRRAVAQRRLVGLRRATIEAQTALGAVLTVLGAVADGRAPLEEAVQAASSLGDDALEASAASALAALEARAGDLTVSNAWAERSRAALSRRSPATPSSSARSQRHRV